MTHERDQRHAGPPRQRGAPAHVTPMPRGRGIAFRLSLFILTSCTLIFAAVFGYTHLFSRRLIRSEIEGNAKNLALRTVSRIESELRAVEKVPENLAYSLEHSSFSREQLLALIRAVVERNPEIYGSTVSFEPYLFDKNTYCFGPYYCRDGAGLRFAWLDDAYDYFKWEWYARPKKTGEPAWTEPYYDKGGGNIIMATYSVPFFTAAGGRRCFAGVATADVYLSGLQEIVSSVRIGLTGYAFLISRDGTIVTHPRRDLIMKETLPRLARGRDDTRMAAIAERMMRGESGFSPATSLLTGKPCWVGYEPIPATGWSLGIVFPRDELMADIIHLNRAGLAIGLAGFTILLAVIVFISGTITRPLRALAAAAAGIARGDLDIQLPAASSGDEVGRLAASFRHMRDSLKGHIRELAAAAAARERIESELKIAREIQMAMLPREIPPFPGGDGVEISAVLEPAREVGGDLYDFFAIGHGRVCVVIGDVSGKGVPAAIFMARTITLLKAAAREVHDPEEILARVNKELARQNESFMFVTVFCGVLDVSNGEFRYSNAGHNPPLVMRGGEKPGFLAGGAGTVLGVEEGAAYGRSRVALLPGDTLFLYTDGVTEAFDGAGEMFTEERLRDELSTRGGGSVEEIADGMLRRIKAHAAGVPQSDDIAIVVVRYRRPPRGAAPAQQAVLTLRNDPACIAELARAAESFGERCAVPAETLHDIRLALEEVVGNIVRYAYADTAEHLIHVRMERGAGELVMEVRDDGVPFNPAERPPPDLSAPPEKRPPGGLGIFLARSVMDSVEYRREDGRNILTLRKRLPQGEA